ncbi:hypothetical protein [Pseudoalteromonas spongiae]|uniref:hypothetical protein n=1 Tax=Pseudoalteromonas spongiae TaxID=298657 RepID=UPI00110B0D9B|nr:hypothetical protein [Pseudoalteromonas spongiae]TMO83535.1 hypothetical protein CWC15_14690 [Pseudoalteromonas spongiae]
MDEGLFSSLGAVSVVVLAAADAVRNDKNLKDDWTRRFKKGIGWAVLFSFIPCILLYAANNSNAKKGEPTYTVLQWVVSLPLTALISITIFTLLFVLRPHPERNSFKPLKVFTLIFWAGAIAFIFYASIFLVNQFALLFV